MTRVTDSLTSIYFNDSTKYTSTLHFNKMFHLVYKHDVVWTQIVQLAFVKTFPASK